MIKFSDGTCVIVHLYSRRNLRINCSRHKRTEVFMMKFKDVKRYLTINKSEINECITLVIKARNAYIDERKPTDDVDELLCKLMKIKKKLRAYKTIILPERNSFVNLYYD